MDQLIEELKKFDVQGFNNHEQMAYNAGYFGKYFPQYLDLKLKLLKAQHNARGVKKRFLNALRIYIYSIWENLWYGYLISYAELNISAFYIDGNALPVFLNPFTNHLPSFSSAILHFGSCRDMFFVLLRLWHNRENSVSNNKINSTIRASYAGKNGRNDFQEHLRSISNNESYIREAMKVYDHNELRNFFAHRMRLLWWQNKKCSPTEYFIKRDAFESIKKRQKDECKKYVLAMMDDEEAYKQNIEECDRSDVIGSGEILRETHDLIANFFNETLGFIRAKIYSVSNIQ